MKKKDFKYAKTIAYYSYNIWQNIEIKYINDDYVIFKDSYNGTMHKHKIYNSFGDYDYLYFIGLFNDRISLLDCMRV